ncbi:MAG TPA: NAD(P)/FAD-dependent oxidoreductase [Acidimicrobiales bacterium]|nr:NAD(P)/FAD-dependent oxidoreductase [Acidimicrobiales bacterium]
MAHFRPRAGVARSRRGSTLRDYYDYDVAVIGGGLAGGSAALAFALQGLSVRVFERRDMARDPNRGDLMHAPTVDIARELGIFDLLRARGATTLRGVETVDPDGALSFKTQVEGSLILNHAELEAAFLEAAEDQGASVESNVARTLTLDTDSTQPGWWVDTGDGATKVRFLVGADGAGSLTRRTLGIALADDHEYDNCIAVLHGDRPAWLEAEHGWQLIHPDGAVFILPTTPVGRVRLVVLIRRSEARDWMTSSEAELAHRLGERHPLLGGIVLTKRGGSHVYRLKRTHAARYAGPRAALCGDAAHTIHSMGGQGLNMAIGDSVQLARLVGPVLAGTSAEEPALDRALGDYEEIRRPVNTELIERADRASQQARPGADAFARALDFYRQAAADPGSLTTFSQRTTGRA